MSGDGDTGIKNYVNCFLNVKFVLDPFHYIQKHMNYIFKEDIISRNIADDYIRNHLIDNFKELVNYQIKKYPEQEKYMEEHMNYIINNIQGIKKIHYINTIVLWRDMLIKDSPDILLLPLMDSLNKG